MNNRNFAFFGLMIGTLMLIGSCAKKTGCTDPEALNYYAEAEVDDGSCTFLETDVATLPIILSGTYKESLVLKNFNRIGDVTGEESYDYQINGICRFNGGLTVEPGVRIRVVGSFSGFWLGEDVQHSFVGNEDNPIIIDSDVSSRKLYLNGGCEFSFVHMNGISPMLEDVTSLTFSDNIVVNAQYGFDFGSSSSSPTEYNPNPFVVEFDRNSFSNIANEAALYVPVSMVSGMGQSNNFDFEPSQYMVAYNPYNSSQFYPYLIGNHVWNSLGIPIKMFGFEVGKSGIGSATLTINEGVLLLMVNSSSVRARITVTSDSKMVINGSASGKVRIKANDDYWQGIDFDANSTGNTFKHAEIARAGRGGPSANIYLSSGASLSVEDTKVSDSDGCGVRVASSAQYEEGSNVTYSNNDNGNVCN